MFVIHVRRIIDMPATRSPNVELALRELGVDPAACVDQETAKDLVRDAIGRKGQPSGETVVPGIMPWEEFLARLLTYDPVRACVGLFSRFWEGSEVRMYPKAWLDHSVALSYSRPVGQRKAKGIGVDPAEGGDSTAMAAVDEFGLLALESHKTPNTSVIVPMVTAFCQKWLPQPARWERVMFDRGGGGKAKADDMRAMGFREIRTTNFGEAITLEPKLGMTLLSDKKEAREDRIYVNRRAEMAYELRSLIDPDSAGNGWAIPKQFMETRAPNGEERGLRKQMEKIPLTYTGEGRIFLIPKTKGEKAEREEDHDGPTIVKLVGFSPDEWDATMLAVRAMLHKPAVGRAGAA